VLGIVLRLSPPLASFGVGLSEVEKHAASWDSSFNYLAIADISKTEPFRGGKVRTSC
jgi:hypothetical protein